MMMGRPANPNRGMRRPSDPEMGLPNASAASASPGNPFSDKYIRIGQASTIFAKMNGLAMACAGIGSLVILLVLTCCGDLMRSFPTNFVLLFLFYIVMDTQLIVGGAKRQCSLSPEDYIAGALMLYLDAINLFLFILQILNQFSGDES
ncbi:hypothetical protein MRX96_002393 [Rhipicephalus microplus]